MEDSSSQSSYLRADILVVHDDPAIRFQIRHLLSNDGFAVREAANTRDALTAIDLALPDLLILPGQVSGADAGLPAALRSHPVRAAMAILALVAGVEQPTLLDAGVDDVLPVPVNPQALRMKVQSLLRLKLAERAVRELAGRHARDQQALQRASLRLGGCTALVEVLTVAAEVIRANLGYDRVSIALYDEETQNLRHVIGTDDQGRVFSPPSRAYFGQSTAG